MKRLFRSDWEKRLGECDSPIERIFMDAFCNHAIECGFDVASRSRGPRFVINVQPQKWIGRYRVDFLISCRYDTQIICIVVECNGHDYHERTKEQARRDSRRLRRLQDMGYIFIPFTGSEIYAEAPDLAREVVDKIERFQSQASAYHFERAKAFARRRAA